MKKNILSIFFFFILFAIPFLVNAKDYNLEIKSVEFIEKSDNTIINSDASFDGDILNLDLTFYDVGDYAKYKLIVFNNTNKALLISKDTIDVSEQYINYDIVSTNGDNTIKPNTSMELELTASYGLAAPRTLFRNSRYVESSEYYLPFINKSISIPNTLKNIGIVTISIFIIIAMLNILGVGIIVNNKVSTRVIIIIGLLLIPSIISAEDEYIIKIKPNIILETVKPNPCTFEGELVQGAEYISDEGTYRYKYKQEWNGSSWINISYDGWGVRLADNTSTEPITEKICSTIKDKPIVSFSYTYAGSQSPSINLAGVDTSNVVNMRSMFSSTPNLTTLDFSSFNTSNVTNMQNMFSGNNISTLYLRHFDVSKVTNFTDMFVGMQNLASLNLDEWDFASKGQTVSLNLNISSLKNLSIKNWKNYGRIENFSSNTGLKNNQLEYLNVTGWDFGNIESLESMFRELKYVKRIDGLDTWDTSKIKSMYAMFENCESLEEIDISSWDTSKVESMSYMFSYLYKARTINVSNINTSSVKRLGGMFYRASSITELDFSSWDTSKVTDFGSMFYQAVNLRHIDVSNFDTSSGKYFYYMFGYNYMLDKLDLSNFTLSSDCSYNDMFINLYSLIELKTPINFTKDISIGKKLYTSDGTEYSSLPKNLSESLVLKVKNEATYLYGYDFNSNLRYMTPNSDAKEIIHYKRSDTLPDLLEFKSFNSYNVVSAADSQYPIYAWYTNDDGGTIYFYCEMEKQYLPTNTYQMFGYLARLETIETKDMDSSRTTSLSYFVKASSRLKELDISHFDTSHVTNLYGAFKYLYEVKELDLSNMDSTNFSDFSETFTGLGVEKLDFSSLDLTNVRYTYTTISDMKYLKEFKTPKKMGTVKIDLPCPMIDDEGNIYTEIDSTTPTSTWLRNLIKVSFSVTYPGSVTENSRIYDPKTDTVYGELPVATLEGKTFAGWYDNSSNGIKITPTTKLPNVNTITLYSGWTSEGSTLIYGRTINAMMKKMVNPNYESSSTMVNEIEHFVRERDSSKVPTELTSDNIISINGSEYPTYMWYDNGTVYYYSESEKIYVASGTNMFQSLPKLKDVNLSDLDFSKTTSLSGLFQDDTSIENIDFSNSDLSSVTDLSSLCERCKNLKTVTFGVQNTINLTSIERMFLDAEKLTTVDVENLNTTNVTDASMLYSKCKSLRTVNLEGFETDSLEYVDEMFRGCSSIERIDFSNHNMDNIKGISNMFTGCSNITYLDISPIWLNVTYADDLFKDCSKLEVLDVGHLTISKLYSSGATSPFNGMTALRELRTPYYIYSNVQVKLPKNMYFEGNSTAVTELTSSSPTGTWIKSTPW